jgi:tetratricopeptide (TPR) repeat protein
MRILLLILVLGCCVGAGAQNSGAPSGTNPPSQDSTAKPHTPNLAPPRSDRVNADSLGDDSGASSSKDTQIDLSPPPDDEKAHPKSSEILMDEETSSGSTGVGEMHPFDPHKAAKDVEVGDYYFKRKNYVAAESRYREALYYKENDALATYRLAVSLEKLDRPAEARTEFENYLKILPHGPQAEAATKEIERLKNAEAGPKAAK